MTEKEKIEEEIEVLENKIGKDHFGGLFDKSGRKRLENQLKKLKKQLAELSKSE